MRDSIKLIVAAAAGAAVSSLVLGPRPVVAGGSDPLADRVTELEKTVVRDPMHPNQSVLDRLTALEQSLRLVAPGDIKTPEDLKTALVRQSIAQDDLDRRLKAVERSSASKTGGDAAEQKVRELKKDVDDNSRDIRDLQDKLRTLGRP